MLSNAVAFLLIPVYTRFLLPSDFGVLEVINNCVAVANIVFSAGFGMAAISLYGKESDPRKKNAVMSTALIGVFALSIMGFVVLFLCAPRLATFFFAGTEHLTLLRLAAFLVLVQLSISVPTSYLLATMHSKIFLVTSLAQSVATIVVNIVLVVLLGMHVKGILLGNIACTVVFLVILTAYTLNRVGFSFDMDCLKRILSFGLPLIPSGIFLFILSNGDRFFIQKLLGSAPLGIYALGYKMGGIVSVLVLTPFMKIWGAWMFEVEKSRDKGAFGRYFLYVTCGYCLIGLWLSLFSPEILWVVSSPDYWSAAKVIPWIAAAYLFWTFSVFFDTGFYLAQRTTLKPVLMGIGAALVFVCYALLIPAFGIMGAAYATLVGFAGFAAVTQYASYRVYPISYPVVKAMEIFFIGAGIFALSSLLPTRISLLTFFIKVLLAIAYPIMLLAGNFVEIKDIKEKCAGLFSKAFPNPNSGRVLS